MSDQQTQNNALATLIGFALIVFTVYTPIYFLILNDDIDAIQEVSIKDMILTPLNERLQSDKNYKRIMSDLDKAFDDALESSKKRSGIDLRIPLEDAVNDDRISKLKWTYGLSQDDYTEIIMVCNNKKYGTIVVSSIVRSRSFFKFRTSKFVAINYISVDGKKSKDYAVFAQTLYKLEGKELSNFQSFITELKNELPFEI